MNKGIKLTKRIGELKETLTSSIYYKQNAWNKRLDGDWSKLWAAIDNIEDAQIAIEEYRSEVSSISKKHLPRYGILQSLVVQQDAIRHMEESLGIKKFQFTNYPELLNIRSIRVETIGHPTTNRRNKGENSFKKGTITYTSIDREQRDGTLTYIVWSSNGPTRKEINIIELIDIQEKLLSREISFTIRKIKKETIMQDEELYKAFKDHDAKYADEVKERWGNTLAYKQSQERMSKMTKEDKINLQKNADIWMKKLVEHMKFGPKSPEVQKLMNEHYNSLRTFYEPNIKMYRGLADMYVSDERFTAYYEKYAKGLAVFMKTAMHEYCDKHE